MKLTADLRRTAEARLLARPVANPAENVGDLHRLQHELEVHQIELELQNEELRAAHAAVEAGLHQRYTELFDFAVTGYFNLAADGAILLVNLAGAKLLGIERGRLLGCRFGLLVIENERIAFADFLARVFASKEPQVIDLALETAGRPAMVVQFDATRSPDGRECRAALTDISARRLAEKKSRNQISELLRWQEVMLDREERVQVLKAEVNELLARLNEPARYAAP